VKEKGEEEKERRKEGEKEKSKERRRGRKKQRALLPCFRLPSNISSGQTIRRNSVEMPVSL
jgi:hypothetical protein